VILKVNHLRDGIPEQVEAEYEPRALDLEFVDLHYLSKVALQGWVERITNTVMFRGALAAQIEQVCARCLDPIVKRIEMPFNLSYEVQREETVDTTGDLRDILLLDHPDRFLCGVGCRGICSQCGANLNREPCRCSGEG